MSRLHTHWESRYRDAKASNIVLPWDSRITPPEVVTFWQSPRGQSIPPAAAALDIGSGTGTNLSYLAGLGFTAFGVELSGTAVATASDRHQSLPQAQRDRIRMINGSAASLPFVGAHFHYVLDIGCLHGLPFAERELYAAGVVRTLVPGGYYHLYGFDRDSFIREEQSAATEVATAAGEEDESQQELRKEQGLGKDEVVTLFGPAMDVVQIDQANPNPKPCRWYLLQKRNNVKTIQL